MASFNAQVEIDLVNSVRTKIASVDRRDTERMRELARKVAKDFCPDAGADEEMINSLLHKALNPLN
jgi:hypothetical protein